MIAHNNSYRGPLKRRMLLSLLMAFLFYWPAAAFAYVPAFDKLLPHLAKGSAAAGQVTVERVIRIPQKETGRSKNVQETLHFTADGRFRLERKTKLGKRILLWNGRLGVDYIAGAGYCQQNSLRLEAVEQLFFARGRSAIKLLAQRLGIDPSLRGMGLGPRGFAYLYGAFREDEKRNQLLVDPTTYKIVGYITPRERDDTISLYKYWFIDYQARDGGQSYPQKIEIYRDGQLQRTIETLKFKASKRVERALFDLKSITSLASPRPTCAALESTTGRDKEDPDSMLEDFQSRFGNDS